MIYIATTTINKPTEALKKFASKIKNNKIDINSIIKKELNGRNTKSHRQRNY